MSKTHRIELDDYDLDQLLDSLNARADAWEKTAMFHRTGKSPADFVVEKCDGADEASRIAAQYRSIISRIHQQQAAQL